MLKPIALALLLAACAAPAAARPNCPATLPKSGEVFTGVVVRVGDGDGICVATARGRVLVRLEDFYAPELSELGGPEAKVALRRLAEGRRVRCRADHRSYDRSVARCTLNGRSLGDLMRAAGVREGGRGWPSKASAR